MLVIAGLSLKNLKPRVWDPESEYYLPQLKAVMVSYAEFHMLPARRKQAMKLGLHKYLGVPDGIKVYLDNGAFYFLSHEGTMPRKQYEKFVERAKPDWYPIPQEFIPTPQMTDDEQQNCFERTMKVNRSFEHDGFVPVIHAGAVLTDYIAAIGANKKLSAKPIIALGGLVPNLLRAPKALPYTTVLAKLCEAREAFSEKEMHVFGIGGTATLHLAALLGFDSVDSSGWRNRAARGIVQLPGSGDRMIADLGKWRGRHPDKAELKILRRCHCPACHTNGLKGLKASGIEGFCNRATHNLWIVLKEAEWIQKRFDAGTYHKSFRRRLDNTIYLPLIESAVKQYQAKQLGSPKPRYNRANHTR
jgi:7-cyano-7-deazaguanine tRNA-ribosyltransferase